MDFLPDGTLYLEDPAALKIPPASERPGATTALPGPGSGRRLEPIEPNSVFLDDGSLRVADPDALAVPDPNTWSAAHPITIVDPISGSGSNWEWDWETGHVRETWMNTIQQDQHEWEKIGKSWDWLAPCCERCAEGMGCGDEQGAGGLPPLPSASRYLSTGLNSYAATLRSTIHFSLPHLNTGNLSISQVGALNTPYVFLLLPASFPAPQDLMVVDKTTDTPDIPTVEELFWLWLFLSLIRGFVFGLTPPPPPPPPPPPQEPKCGPEVTSWLMTQLQNNRARMAAEKDSYQSGGRARDEAILSRDTRSRSTAQDPLHLYNIFDRLVRGPWNFNEEYNLSSGDCPTACPGTVTLCGKCVADNVPEDINFAYAGSAACSRQMLRTAADYVANRSRGRVAIGSAIEAVGNRLNLPHFPGLNDMPTAHAACSVGFSLASDPEALKSKEEFCGHVLAAIDAGGIPLSDCPPCETADYQG
jgi:hypothetical protein